MWNGTPKDIKVEVSTYGLSDQDDLLIMQAVMTTLDALKQGRTWEAELLSLHEKEIS